VDARLGQLLGDTRRQLLARDTSTWEDKEAAVLRECHPKQQGFVLDPGRRVAAGRARFVRRMLRVPGARCLYIATTRTQAEELMWAPLKDLVEKLGIEATFNETKLKVTFKRNRSWLRLVGADDKREIEKLRGQPFHEVGIDEAASHDAQLLEHLLVRIIGPRLGDFDGVLWLIGTPGHILSGPFYAATRPGSDIHRKWEDRAKPEFRDWARWSFHAWNLEDASEYVPAIGKLWQEAKLEKEANGWSDQNPVWRREYLGLWAADDTENVYKYRPHLEDGTPWNQWDPEKTPQGFAKLPDGDWRFVFGMDMGHHDPFALAVFAYQPTSRTLYHVYEFEKRGMYARTIAELLIGDELDHEDPTGVIGKTGWPEGMCADTAGLGDAMLTELSQVYGLQIKPAEKKNKFDSVELFNGDLIDGHIKVMKGSRLEEQLLGLQWAVDDVGRLKENKGQRNDCTDAAIYARRMAQHMFAEEAPNPRPAKGTPAARDLEMKEAEERAANRAQDEFGLLSDEPFDDLFGN
jgi:hypothetical protein